MKKAQARRRVLVDYTKHRTIKELDAEVEKARGDELSKQAIWDLEKRKQIKLERQIANCTIVAPIDGSIQDFLVGEGQRVHDGASALQHHSHRRSQAQGPLTRPEGQPLEASHRPGGWGGLNPASRPLTDPSLW